MGSALDEHNGSVFALCNPEQAHSDGSHIACSYLWWLEVKVHQALGDTSESMSSLGQGFTRHSVRLPCRSAGMVVSLLNGL